MVATRHPSGGAPSATSAPGAPMLDVRRLRVLREVSERGSVTSAAEALHCTPSAVSQQLAALEREIGLPLVERRGRSVAITDAGRVLVDHSVDVFRAIEVAATAVQEARAGIHGPFHVASFASAATAFAIAALMGLEADHPGLEVHLREAEADDALRELRLGRNDLVIAQEYRHVPEERFAGLVVHRLFEDDLLLAVPEADERRHRTSLADHADSRWIMPLPEHTSCGKAILHACNHHGFTPTVRAHVEDFALTLQLVAQGFGVALVPWLRARGPVPGVRLIPIDSPRFARVTSAVVRPASSGAPAVTAAIDRLRAAAAAAVGPGGRALA
ncbi:MAG: LysR family transcriptional regulator [Actinomycetota bacterium]|nr:LysR family transcriptional regulator [Actinomycetota bacterium]